MRKHLLEIVAIVFISLILLELTLTLYYFFANKTFDKKEVIAYRERTADVLIPIPFQINPKKDWENRLVIHPFFGYVYDSRLKGINNFGFPTKYNILISKSGYRLTDKNKDKSLVVGIFGGSFAEQAGMRNEYLEAKLSEIFPSKKIIGLIWQSEDTRYPNPPLFLYISENCLMLSFLLMD